MAGGDSVNLIAAFGFIKKEVYPIFQQVVPTVENLHKRNISHWYIKAKNILIDVAGNIKLCDFGMAIKVTSGQMLEEINGINLFSTRGFGGQRLPRTL